jgi:hypothetical protein
MKVYIYIYIYTHIHIHMCVCVNEIRLAQNEVLVASLRDSSDVGLWIAVEPVKFLIQQIISTVPIALQLADSFRPHTPKSCPGNEFRIHLYLKYAKSRPGHSFWSVVSVVCYHI